MADAKYLLVQRDYEGHGELGEAHRRYFERLEAARDRIPAELYEFATASWHYDHLDRRALHDSRLRAFTVREDSARGGTFGLSIQIVLLAPYFDRELHLSYRDVTRYTIGIPETAQRAPVGSHGDLLTDEVVVLPDGSLLHALQFSRGSTVEIVFGGPFEYSFTEPAGASPAQ